MKTTIQKLEEIDFEFHCTNAGDNRKNILAVRRALFLLAHEIDEMKAFMKYIKTKKP